MILKWWLGAFLLLGSGMVAAQSEYQESMYLLRVDVNSPAEAKLCYTNRFDRESVKIIYEYEDTINYLADFIYEEEELYGPECFVPELKLVFKYYTYVVSLYCATAVKYKNSAPYRASATQMPNDLIFTQSVYDYLYSLKLKHFGNVKPSEALLKELNLEAPLEDEVDNDEIDILSLDEEDEDEENLLDPEDIELLKKDDPPAPPKKRKIIPLEVEDDDGR
jgi:hypothetical protein